MLLCSFLFSFSLLIHVHTFHHITYREGAPGRGRTMMIGKGLMGDGVGRKREREGGVTVFSFSIYTFFPISLDGFWVLSFACR